MCGIFGIASVNGSLLPEYALKKIIWRLYKLSETRGKEASGVSFVEDGVIKVIKQNTPARVLLRSKPFIENITTHLRQHTHGTTHSLCLMGHARLVTNGASSLHFNNQPVIAAGLVAVHNGIIVNDAELWDKHPHFKRHYQVDTEIFLNLLRSFMKVEDSLVGAVRRTFELIQGATSVAVQFTDRNSLLLATNNGSLYIAQTKDFILFASEDFIVRSVINGVRELRRLRDAIAIRQVKPGQALLVNLEDLSQTEFRTNSRGESRTTDVQRPARAIVDVLAPHQAQSTPQVKILSVPAELEKNFADRRAVISQIRRCTKCILPATMPFISFDDSGVCSYCLNYRKIQLRGIDALRERLNSHRKNNGSYDCIVSLSGGRDSSYGLHYAKQVLGLNPITYTYDWGMVTDLARRNISRICGKLGIEHILISADIKKKRDNVRKNVSAWLKNPDLGMIPLFMAGDKQFFYHGARLKKQLKIDLTVISENLLEKTLFKSGFCGISPDGSGQNTYTLALSNKAKMTWYYLRAFLENPSYINSSLLDTALAYCSYYVMTHNFLFLYQYVPWREEEVEKVLFDEYDWELAPDTNTTWRIGDGTAAFYNYIYYMLAGLTENDTFRSNQVREGHIDRPTALALADRDNHPRWETIAWYCETVGVDLVRCIKRINETEPLYQL